MNRRLGLISLVLSTMSAMSSPALAKCVEKDLPTRNQLVASLTRVVESGNGGIFKPNAMWITMVNRSGEVCAVVKVGDAWPGSRVISAQKANTANAFSNDRLSLSTANIYSAVQPGGSLYGLQHSNPVDPAVAYRGKDGSKFGTSDDPMVGGRVGGVNVFGGGLALYGKDRKTVIGAIGVSGDSSCADHIIAWHIRAELGLDTIPGGVSGAKDDNIIHDIENGKSTGGFGHPVCSADATKIAKELVLSEKLKK
jgi:uncharacterized protein GlcG (DUF336 family)